MQSNYDYENHDFIAIGQQYCGNPINYDTQGQLRACADYGLKYFLSKDSWWDDVTFCPGNYYRQGSWRCDIGDTNRDWLWKAQWSYGFKQTRYFDYSYSSWMC